MGPVVSLFSSWSKMTVWSLVVDGGRDVGEFLRSRWNRGKLVMKRVDSVYTLWDNKDVRGKSSTGKMEKENDYSQDTY